MTDDEARHREGHVKSKHNQRTSTVLQAVSLRDDTTRATAEVGVIRLSVFLHVDTSRATAASVCRLRRPERCILARVPAEAVLRSHPGSGATRYPALGPWAHSLMAGPAQAHGYAAAW